MNQSGSTTIDFAKIPKKGDPYYPTFSGDVDKLGPAPLTIEEVHRPIECGKDVAGFEIRASDGIYYDCCWSDLLRAWVYGITPPDRIHYKGYSGSVYPSENDEERAWCGTVLNADGFLGYEGDNLEEVVQSFRTTVDEYIEELAEAKKEIEEKFFKNDVKISLSDLFNHAVELASVKGKNSQYDRGLIELLMLAADMQSELAYHHGFREIIREKRGETR